MTVKNSAADFHGAITSGQIATVKRMIDEAPKHLNTEEYTFCIPQKGLPLHTAAAYGQTAMIDILIEAGTPVDVKNNTQETALYYATIWGHADTIERLLQHGADPIAVQGATKKTSEEIIQDLPHMDPTGKILALLKKAREQHEEQARQLEKKLEQEKHDRHIQNLGKLDALLKRNKSRGPK